MTVLLGAVAAAGRHLDAIAQLEADGRLHTQPYVVRLVADARRETPEATLAELAERCGLHRSAVQRALERIERLEEDKAAVMADMKEVFLEAKGEGYDVKILRKVIRLR